MELLGILTQVSSGGVPPAPTTLEQIGDIAQITQGFVTAIAALVAGIWVLYVYVLGRSYAPSVQFGFTVKRVLNTTKGNAAILQVRLINRGTAQVRRRTVSLAYRAVLGNPIDRTELEQQERLGEIIVESDPLDPRLQGVRWISELFKPLVGLEPGEVAIEEVIIPLGDAELFKVVAVFEARPGKLRTLASKYSRSGRLMVSVFYSEAFLDTTGFSARSSV
jgi:hypothetical protein